MIIIYNQFYFLNHFFVVYCNFKCILVFYNFKYNINIYKHTIMNIYNIFNEEEEFIGYKFSTVLLFIFIYYSLSYYFLMKSPVQKPHVSKMMIMLILHIIHIILLKFLHQRENYMYMWIAAIVPLVIYMLYSKYQKHIQDKEDAKMAAMYAQMQAEQDKGTENMRNATPQRPNAPPMQGTQYVGISNNGNRLGDQVPYHQLQHNNPLHPTNPAPARQLPQIAHQPEQMSNVFSNNGPAVYDSDSLNNYRTNNTVSEPIQQMQTLDMNAVGGGAGSMSGFDPYGSSFASF